MSYREDNADAREVYVLALARDVLLASVSAQIAKSGHYRPDLDAQESVQAARHLVNTMTWSLPVVDAPRAPWLPIITEVKR